MTLSLSLFSPDTVLEDVFIAAQGVGALSHHKPHVCETGHHLRHIIPRSRHCLTCSQLKGKNPTNAPQSGATVDQQHARAVAAGAQFYFPETLCPSCGTTAERSTDGAWCAGCESLVAAPARPGRRGDPARVLARTHGKRFYWPQELCSECGWMAARVTQTGHCTACQRLTGAEKHLRAMSVDTPQMLGLRVWESEGVWYYDPQRAG